MLCMRRAMAERIVDDELRAALDAPLAQLADHMRNQAEPA
jgi:truncated hemoglobin YjbI